MKRSEAIQFIVAEIQGLGKWQDEKPENAIWQANNILNILEKNVGMEPPMHGFGPEGPDYYVSNEWESEDE